MIYLFVLNSLTRFTTRTEELSKSRGLFFKPICSGVVPVNVNLVRCCIVFFIKKKKKKKKKKKRT